LKCAPDAAPSERTSTNRAIACTSAIRTTSTFPVPAGGAAVAETARTMKSTSTNVPSSSAA
jgi:hypothetical protein